MDTKILIAIISAIVAVIGAFLSFYSANKNFKLNRNSQAIDYLNGKLEKAIERLNNIETNKVDKKDFLKEGVIHLEKYFDNSVETYDKFRSYLTSFTNEKKLEKEIEQTKISLTKHRIGEKTNSENKKSPSSILTSDEIMKNYIKIPKEINKVFNAELKMTIKHLEKIIGYKE